jgi:DNA-binding MarR family transcriptional regulator
MKAKVKDDTPVIWITEEEFPGSALPPQLYLIEKEIRDFVARDTVVLLGRLDYLVAKLGFEEVLKLVQKLNELFYIRKGVLILSVDPSTLTSQQLSLLEKETREVELRIKPGIRGELYDILEYVHEENRVGKKPYHRDVAEKFNITKVTAVKRLKALKAMGLLMDRRKGRYKALELTEQGRAFF